jgi:hypothetical protein
MYIYIELALHVKVAFRGTSLIEETVGHTHQYDTYEKRNPDRSSTESTSYILIRRKLDSTMESILRGK